MVRTVNCSNTPWVSDEIKTLRKTYKNTFTPDLAKRFGRSPNAIQKKANRLGLRKTKKYMQGLSLRKKRV